jgi:hypothetical protein
MFAGAADKIPVIPVEPGIFSILPRKLPFGCKKSEAAQALAGEFP